MVSFCSDADGQNIPPNIEEADEWPNIQEVRGI